jgi:hypothetical protein
MVAYPTPESRSKLKRNAVRDWEEVQFLLQPHNADLYLYKEWEREFDRFAANGNLPNLTLLRLPHDHFGNFASALYGLNTSV